MLEIFDKEVRNLKENLKKYKIESFDELFKMLKENEKLKQRIFALEESRENEIKRIKVDNEIALNKLQSKHEMEMVSLKHTIQMERTRIETETKQKISEMEITFRQKIKEVEHALNLERKEFVKEKETMLLQVKEQIFNERQKFLEANNNDTKNNLKDNWDKIIQGLSLFMEKINFSSQHKLISGKDEDININVNKKQDAA